MVKNIFVGYLLSLVCILLLSPNVYAEDADIDPATQGDINEVMNEVVEVKEELTSLEDRLVATQKEFEEKNTIGIGRDYEQEINLQGRFRLNEALKVYAQYDGERYAVRLPVGTKFLFVGESLDRKEFKIRPDCGFLPLDEGNCLEKHIITDEITEPVEGVIPNPPVMDNDGVLRLELPTQFETEQFWVNKENIGKNSYTLSRAVDHGVLIVPFKFRTDDKSITGEAGVGYYVGMRSDTALFSGTTFISAGLSVIPNIPADELSNDDGETSVELENVAALTMAIGYSFATKSNFQVSLLVGRDRIGGSTGKRWQHENDDWYSIAIGYNFLRR